jgi:hypothetical protein
VLGLQSGIRVLVPDTATPVSQRPLGQVFRTGLGMMPITGASRGANFVERNVRPTGVRQTAQSWGSGTRAQPIMVIFQSFRQMP